MLSKPQFRPFISRTQRFIRFWRTRPRFWMNVYPLQFWSYLLLGVPSTIVFLIKAYQRAPTGGTDKRPYYRDHYEVRRPNDIIALKWRLPEEYPADYVSNRLSFETLSASTDYGWNLKFGD